MYTNERKGGRLLNFILGIIGIIIIIFVIIWIINKGHNSNKDVQVFNNNLSQMQTTANDYFNNNLPENVGEVYKVSLKEMYALGLSDKLYYGSIACDADDSYISAAKTNLNEYKIKSTLVCGDKIDTKIKTIRVNSNNNNTTTNNTIVDPTTNTNTNTVCPACPVCENTCPACVCPSCENQNTNTPTNNNTCTNNTTCVGVGCNITTGGPCDVIFNYQYAKKVYGCPKDYIMTNDGKCVKQSSDSIDATAKPNTYTVPAERTQDVNTKVYTTPITTPGTTEYYCKEGTLLNGKCYIYTDVLEEKIKNYTCPSGYTKTGSGANTKCSKTTTEYATPSVTETSTYSCPSGYDKSGSGASTTCSKTTTEYATPSVTETSTYSCPSGYDKSGSGASTTCSKTTTEYATPNKTYTDWGNPVRIFSQDTPASTYESELSKLVETGRTCKTLFGTTTCTYTYAYYERSISGYSCPYGYTKSGSGSNTTCSKQSTSYVNPTKSTTYSYSCPYGYTKSGSGSSTTCSKQSTSYVNPTKTTTYTYSCPYGYTKSGSGSNTTCSKQGTSYVNPTKTTTYTYSCPYGYTKSGSGSNTTCSKQSTSYVNPIKTTTYTYSCPSGYTKSGSGSNTTCSKQGTSYADPIISYTYNYYCPSGYNKDGNKCYKTSEPDKRVTETIYSCPSGYQKEGYGSNTKCYKIITTPGTYYCSNNKAKLQGDKCIITEGYTYSCPSNYTLKGTKCYKTTNIYTDMIVIDTQYTYSTSESLPGYVRTGRYYITYDCHEEK